jgi:hypothetical protein
MPPFPDLVVENLADLDPAPAVETAANRVELDVKVEKSDLEDWCWAAVSLGVAKGYKNLAKTEQCVIVTLIHNQDNGHAGAINCCLPPSHELIKCNTAHTLKEPLAPHHARTLKHDDPSPDHRIFKFIKDEIDAGRPVAVRIQFSDANKRGHFVVVAGYVLPNTLLVWDPDQKLNKPKEVPFEEFRDKYGGAGMWDQSYLTQGADGTQAKVEMKKGSVPS